MASQLFTLSLLQAFNQQDRERSRFSDAVERVFATAKKRMLLRAVMTAIVGAMATQPEGFLWFRKGEFDEDVFTSDLSDELPGYYARRGFIDFARVDAPAGVVDLEAPGDGGTRGYWTDGRHFDPVEGRWRHATALKPIPYGGGGLPAGAGPPGFRARDAGDGDDQLHGDRLGGAAGALVVGGDRGVQGCADVGPVQKQEDLEGDRAG